MREAVEAMGQDDPWAPPEDATPEQVAEFEAFMARMLVPDETITTWIDLDEDPSTASGKRSTSTSPRSPRTAGSCSSGWTAGARSGAAEAYILRESRVPTETPESDLFAGIA